MFIKNIEQQSFSLDTFEGPLDFLLYLIQKNEIDIYNISIQKITEQYKATMKEDSFAETGAEFVGLTASLLWIKSKMLLPKHEQETEEEEIDPEFAIIHHLLDYCKFKEIAKDLADKELKQQGFYARGKDATVDVPKKPLGLENLTLEDLASVFQQIMLKAKTGKGLITKETWQVSDKIRAIQALIRIGKKIGLHSLFTSEQCREEMIVTFLAVLELMKLGEIKVVRETSTNTIMIVA